MLNRYRGLPGAISLLAVVALVSFGACGSDDDGSAEEPDATTAEEASVSPPADLARDGQLTVCTDPSYPPLESFDEDGDYVGFDIDVARAVAEVWGIEARFQETSFDGLLPALDAGRCDVAWSGLFINPERTERFSAVPYQTTASVIMVQEGNPEDVSSPDDLAGKTVASQNGTNLLRMARQISEENEASGLGASNVQGYDKFNEAIQQLAVGRAHAVITQDIDAAAREQAQPGAFEVVYTFDDAETFGVYYRPDNAELGERLHEALAQLEEEGRLTEIAEANQMPVDGIAVETPIDAQQG